MVEINSYSGHYSRKKNGAARDVSIFIPELLAWKRSGMPKIIAFD
jgi:hypothetical protein